MNFRYFKDFVLIHLMRQINYDHLEFWPDVNSELIRTPGELVLSSLLSFLCLLLVWVYALLVAWGSYRAPGLYKLMQHVILASSAPNA